VIQQGKVISSERFARLSCLHPEVLTSQVQVSG
jgi:hypothetical protein